MVGNEVVGVCDSRGLVEVAAAAALERRGVLEGKEAEEALAAASLELEAAYRVRREMVEGVEGR